MLHSNGLDPQVRDYVLASPGAAQLIERSLYRARTLLELPNDGRRVDLHVLCGGGRHRSVVVAEELATRIRRTGCGVETEHLHIDRPILHVTWQPELTDHQLLALRLLARGHTHTQIAVILRVKPETAGQLIHGVRTALRARTLPHAVAIGSEIGLLGQPRSS
ncbi:hypothetical protein LNW73_35570 [Streptomyces sp. RKAG337]|nr:RNase adapter RapZ [Streptomyces sp. RKAG337]MCM2431070.1 hypothetical protein [Streptomyces sp. RKAG337]